MSKDDTNDNTGDYGKLDGPNRFYRTRRISLDEFKGLDILLEVSGPNGPLANGIPKNLSSTGLMVTFPGVVPVKSNDHLALGLWIESYLVYKGRTVIRRIDKKKETTNVAFEFSDGLVNPDDVSRVARMLSGVEDLQEKVLNWHPEYEENDDTREYMTLLAEFRAFMVAAKRELNKFEKEMGPMDLDTPGFKEMFAALVQKITPVYESYVEKFDAIRRRLAPAADKAMKVMVRLAIHDLILEAPQFRRSFYKPRGYPGDYKLMAYLYEDHWEGDSLFAKYVHYTSCVAPASYAVPSRKELVKDILRKKMGMVGPDKKFRFLSIAAGPAQETYELLQELDDASPMLDVVLYEQDEEALEFSYNRVLSRVRELNLGDRVNVTFLHDSVRNLIAKPIKENILSRVGEFDMIFATGLFDYLQEKYASSLIAKFYTFLNPGGTMAIGNMDGWNPNRWTMEHLLEWNLVYKTKDELYHLGDSLPDDAERTMDVEETGINNFLIIKKPVHGS